MTQGALRQPRGVGCGGEWEGGLRRRGHIYIYIYILRLIYAVVWQKPTKHCQVIILHLKINL